ncbi:MAG: rRNA adenine dimethyltransferase family protein, partial [bacterium]|nr:rRNA adenine dimethyltransferase family protein [bacterium]
YKIVANLPFYITAPVIRRFLEISDTEFRPTEMILMIQKEVAQRICAKPPKMNLLAVSVQFYSKPEIIGYVSKKSFWPQPKVDAGIIKITPLIAIDKKPLRPELFFSIVKAGFSHPRKQISNNLSKELATDHLNKLKLEKEMINLWLLKNKIKPERRAETLDITDWTNLAESYFE